MFFWSVDNSQGERRKLLFNQVPKLILSPPFCGKLLYISDLHIKNCVNHRKAYSQLCNITTELANRLKKMKKVAFQTYDIIFVQKM